MELPEAITRKEAYYAYLTGTGTNYPKPVTREEQYLYYLCENGGIGGGGTGSVSIDATLTKPGKAADAKATGDKFQAMADVLNHRPHVLTLTDFFNMQRTGKVYQTKLWKTASNPSSAGIKLLDNAGLEFSPSTDTTEGVDDYAEIPLFDWWHCNYIREDNGDVTITAIEGDSEFSKTGSVDVGAFGMSFYWNWNDSNDDYTLVTISDSPHPELGLVPWVECVRADGSVAPYWCHSAYPSVVASDGLLRSQPGGKLAREQSYTNMIVNYAKKGAGYTGAGACRNTFQIIFNAIMGATKNSQALYAGVTSWDFQYDTAVERHTDDIYFPVTPAQANTLEVGGCVSVGYALNNNGALNKDRGQATIHAYADDVKILRIDDMDDGNKAVYLDIEQGFNTTPVALTDTLTSPVIMSSMHMNTGETDAVLGKHNGSAVSNTSGKHSYRVQGTEYALGAYIIASDIVMDIQSDHSKNVYAASRGTAHSNSDAVIRDTYEMIGNIPDVNGAVWWIGDIEIDTDSGAWWPSVAGSSDKQGFGDKCEVGSEEPSVTREYLQGGYLRHGSSAGSAFVNCWNWLGSAYWHFAAAD